MDAEVKDDCLELFGPDVHGLKPEEIAELRQWDEQFQKAYGPGEERPDFAELRRKIFKRLYELMPVMLHECECAANLRQDSDQLLTTLYPQGVPEGVTVEMAAQAIRLLHADNHRLRLGDMSGFDYERLVDWINNPERKDPSSAFTAGSARTAAHAVVNSEVLKRLESSARESATTKAALAECCATEDAIRANCAKVLGQAYVEGDSHGVPPLDDLVGKVVERCLSAEREAAALREEVAKLRSVLNQILGWDCIAPVPRQDLCHDLPWLKRLVEDALKSGATHE